MSRTGAFLGLSLLYGLAAGSPLHSEQWTVMDFLGSDSGMEQMDSTLIFRRTLNAGHTQSQLTRVPRGAGDDNLECCTKDAKQFSVNETSIIAKCTLDMKPQKAAPQWTVKQTVCILDCITKEYDVVDGEGYLDAEKTTTLVKSIDQWGQIFADKGSLINRCVTFANGFSKERGTVMLEEKKCNIASAVVANCIRSMVETNCPEDRKVASAKCDEFRRKLSEVIDVLNV